MPRTRIFFDVRQNGDSTGDPWTKLDFFCLFMLCVIGFCFLTMLCLKALAYIFTFYRTWHGHASLYYCYYVLRAHTCNFKVKWGTSSLPYDLSQGLSLCKPQLFAECLD